MKRFLVAIAVAVVLAAPAGLLSAQTTEGSRGGAARTAERPPTPAPAPEQSADEVRDELSRLFEQYPPSLPQVLRLDPSLLGNKDYLAPYPALASFLARHPEVAHNPGFFMGGINQGRGGYYVAPVRSARIEALNSMKDVIAGFLVLIAFSLVVSLTAWGLKNFIDYRRWLRISKLQTETHARLLERLTSNDELLSYIQSPAGRQFLEGAPLPNASPGRVLSAPVNRILWSVQVGVVLALAGAGLMYARRYVIEDVGEPLAVLGVLNAFLGAGFVLSSLVAYMLSRMLGLFDKPAALPHA